MDIGNISLNDGTVVLIRSEKDLLDIIKKYLSHDIGNEFEKYLENKDEIIQDLNNDIEELEQYINDLEEKYYNE